MVTKVAPVIAATVVVGIVCAAWSLWPWPEVTLRPESLGRYAASEKGPALARELRIRAHFPGPWLQLRSAMSTLRPSVPSCFQDQGPGLLDAQEFSTGMAVLRELARGVEDSGEVTISATREHEVALVRDLRTLVRVIRCLGEHAVARKNPGSVSDTVATLYVVARAAAQGPLGGELAARDALRGANALVESARKEGFVLKKQEHGAVLPRLNDLVELDRVRLLATVVESLVGCEANSRAMICRADPNIVLEEINAHFDRATAACTDCVKPPRAECLAASRVPPWSEPNPFEQFFRSPRARQEAYSRALGRLLLVSDDVVVRAHNCLQAEAVSERN